MTATRATPGSATERARGGRRLSDGRTLYWWAELLAVITFYLVYSKIRNANEGSYTEAFDNARRVIHLQRSLGLFVEEHLQHLALHFKPLVIACNYFYGSLHFVVTIGAALFLYHRYSDDYPRFRNTLGVTTAIALIGFVTFPLMPPRLLPVHSYGFVDTLARYPTFWSFNSGAMSKISNQYAAMPSVHVAWSTWCALVLVPRLRANWAKVLAALYPLMTVTVIVLTGNHYLLDAVGGLVVLAIGYAIAHRFTRAGRSRVVAAEPAING